MDVWVLTEEEIDPPYSVIPLGVYSSIEMAKSNSALPCDINWVAISDDELQAGLNRVDYVIEKYTVDAS